MFVFGKDGDGFLVKEDLTAAVAELANSKQVVLEGGHYMAVPGRKGGQVEVGGCGGGVDAARGVTYVRCGGVRVDIVDGGVGVMYMSLVPVSAVAVSDMGMLGGARLHLGGAGLQLGR